ncbi:hypothetical protein C0992_006566 [Termitomyces sp. T32_za158]|nr:hypothetical protein C0992_006566 [Termitomyces sp. T32_za158]
MEFLKMIQHIMAWQRILESGLVKSKQEQDSAVGYIYNIDTNMHQRSLQPIPGVPVITNHELDRLVVAAHDETLHILKDILHMSVPKLKAGKPVSLLHSLGAASRTSNWKNKSLDNKEYMTDDDDLEDCDDGDVSDYEIMPTEIIGSDSQIHNHMVDKMSAQASSHVAWYSALCDDLDNVLMEAGLT